MSAGVLITLISNMIADTLRIKLWRKLWLTNCLLSWNGALLIFDRCNVPPVDSEEFNLTENQIQYLTIPYDKSKDVSNFVWLKYLSDVIYCNMWRCLPMSMGIARETTIYHGPSSVYSVSIRPWAANLQLIDT